MKRLLTGLLWAARPTLWAAWVANRNKTLPGFDHAKNQAHLDDARAALAPSLTDIADHQRELVLLSVAHDRERITALESKGLAVSALPSAVAAVAALMVGHGILLTTFAAVAFTYVGCALFSASQLLRPRPRQVFSIEDAIETDGLIRLAAATRANSPIGVVLNNWVSAAVSDTARAAAFVIIGGLIAFFSHISHQPSQASGHCADAGNTCPHGVRSAYTPGFDAAKSTTPLASRVADAAVAHRGQADRRTACARGTTQPRQCRPTADAGVVAPLNCRVVKTAHRLRRATLG